MSSGQIKQQIIQWCQEPGDLELVEPSMTNDDLELIVRSRKTGVSYKVHRAQDQDWITIEYSFKVPASKVEFRTPDGVQSPSFSDTLKGLFESRPALFQGETMRQGNDFAINLSATAFEDGLTKHVFVCAVDEVARTKRLVELIAEDIWEQQQALSRIEATFASARKDGIPPTVGTPERRCANGHLIPSGKKFCTIDGLPAQ